MRSWSADAFFAGISHAGYTLQTVGNALYFITSGIAALLYGNIGLKVLYASVMRDAFSFPALETRGGKIAWVFFGKSPEILKLSLSMTRHFDFRYGRH